MPTVYSGNYSTGTYTYTRVRVDYSGTSATATLLYTRTNNYTPATYDTGLTFTFGGVSTVVSISYSGPQTDAPVASVTFPISTSGGTYSGQAVGQIGTLFNFSGSVNIPSQWEPVAPPPPTITFSNITHNSVIATYSVPNWGDPDIGRVRRWYGTDPNPTTNEALPDSGYSSRRAITEVLTGLQPNTTYYVRAFTGNTQLGGSATIASFTTAKTPIPVPLYRFYVPVLTKSTGARKGYVSVDGKSKMLLKLYSSVSGKSKLIYKEGS